MPSNDAMVNNHSNAQEQPRGNRTHANCARQASVSITVNGSTKYQQDADSSQHSSSDDNSDDNDRDDLTQNADRGSGSFMGESLIDVTVREIAREKSERSEPYATNDSNNNDREKRLAMNRVSARERRKRKRDLIEELQESAGDLSRQNNSLRDMNEGLRLQLEHLATALTNGLDAQRSVPFGLTPTIASVINPVQDLVERPTLFSLHLQQQQRAIALANMSGLRFAGSTNPHSSMFDGNEIRLMRKFEHL